MLLNTWLLAAKRQLFGSSNFARGTERRNSAARRSPSHGGEQLEARQLLTALVINDLNVDQFVDSTGTLAIANNHITDGGFDGLVIENVSLSSPSEAISINLSGITLNRLAIETVDVTAFSGTAIDINLMNVLGNRTISLEDINVSTTGGLGLNVNLDGTNTHALTIEDDILPGVVVSAINGSVITHGIVTQNTIDSPAETEGFLLNVNTGGQANDFRIVDNVEVSALNRDAIRINADDAPIDGLVIKDNVIGNEPGADVLFRAEGDTFAQPFELTSLATDNEQLTQFVLDLRPLGLVFSPESLTSPFVIVDPASPFAGNFTDALSDNNQVLTIDFQQFASGQTFLFRIDVDVLAANPADPPIDFSAFGNDLIGANVEFSFGAGTNSGPKQVIGSLIGDANVLSASEFARGNGQTTGFHGINLDLSNSPLTNSSITTNQITGVAGHGIAVDARGFSDVSAVLSGNDIVAGSLDGINFKLRDSNFTGAILDNTIGLNSGNGISFEPSVSRTGLIEDANNSNPFTIISTNHQLQTGDQIIVQGMVNDDPTINHPGNGLHTVTRVGNDRFELQGVDGTAANISFSGGGSWYVPDFQPDGSARGLVSIDLQASEPQGRIRNIQSPGGGGDAIITSLDHGLATGDRVRISRADGTGISGTTSFKISVINEDSFSLDGQPLVGTYDTSGGLANWTTNIIENVSSTDQIVITSLGHGLTTGDQVRVTGVRLTDDSVNAAANGRWTVTRLTDDTFALQNSTANGVYVPGSGYWIPFAETTFTGHKLPQLISGNSVTENGIAGLHVDLTTGTRFNGDVVDNTFSLNDKKGVYIESHSFGLGTELPLDPNDETALPSVQDISFNVNIGTSTTDGNIVNGNKEAGIVIEALDFATGSFEIRGNQLNSNEDDNLASTPYRGDGIHVRLDSDRQSAESLGFLAESVIANNQIGVDSRGNEGNGLSFLMADRTKIQDLEVLDNKFVNNMLDGFHFVRTEDADLNAVVFDGNAATNNVGDGFDIFAENTIKDRQDFRILDSVIDNNGEYGVRIDVQAAARVQLDIEGSTIRKNGSVGNGFNPDDNDTTHRDGTAQGEAGGIGIHGFENVDIILNITESTIEKNIGDGVSIDAEDANDTLIVNAKIVDSKLNLNTRTGLRNVGTAFGTFELTRNDFNGNGTDGARFISNVQVNDPVERRRVGGQDIDIIGLGNDFQANTGNGLVLGQGVSATFGNGNPTVNFANRFGGRLSEDLDTTRRAGSQAGNGEDGLKIVQDAGPELRSLARRRVIETDGNEFTFNTGDGVDIGHHVASEGTGNVLHGDEVASDVDVIIARAIISNNRGDGVEYLADSVLRVVPGNGSGQDNLPNPNISSLMISDSDIKNNAQRGVDILNRVSEDSRITLHDNEIIGNGFSGVYVVNTSTHDQLQDGPEDPLTVLYGSTGGTPNIELRIQDNLIESNGTAQRQSTVPLNLSDDNGNSNLYPGALGDNNAQANRSYHHETHLTNGTLGGLVIRVGTTDTSGRITAADPEFELGLSGIDAEVWKNSFDGNFGADVYFDNFVSAVPPQTGSLFSIQHNPDYRWNIGFRDPLARLDLVFRENTGNSLDVINGFAFLDNTESLFKSRIANGGGIPDPDGVFSNASRQRNATRTIGYLDNVGGVPGAQAISIAPGGLWSYDGWGTPTWRVESDFDFNSFTQSGTVSGNSDFFDVVNLDGGLAEEPYQWDTGRNVPGFTGNTPYSLRRGDIFDVQDNEAPILADQLEENDSFVGAYDLGTIAGTGFNVNALTTNGNLNIERKGDRDYYKFIAAGTGSLVVRLTATDLIGDDLQYLIYEVDNTKRSGEVPMVAAGNGTPIRTTVAAGGTANIIVNVTAGRTYIVEVLSDETSNLGRTTDAKPFNYGTVRSYSLVLDAPAAPPPVFAAPAVIAPVTVTEVTSAPGVTAPISIAGVSPTVASITNVSPDPIGTSVDSLTVTFSEDVSGVDLTDFQLSRNGIVLDLSGAILTPTSLETYELSNLSPLTNVRGTYTFTVLVDTSGIVDTDSSAIVAGTNDTETWTLENTISFTGDVTDNVPGDGIIGDASGNASLRAAIMETNANFGRDIINLAPGTYVLSIGGRFEDSALTGDLDITDHLTIRGTGTSALDTIIDAAQLDRVFHVFPGVELILENLTVRGGESFDGAGLLVEGLAVAGGTQQSTGGIVRMTDVNVINNEAYNQGGGIYNLGTVEAVRSSISMNVAGSRGGGIFNHSSVNLLNTTISTNTAVSRGGGIYNEVAASYVNGNQSPSQTFGSVRATNATIAFNKADAEGGGIYQEQNGSVRIGNSILDQNTALAFPEINRPINSDNYNFIGKLGTVTGTSLLLGLNDIVGDVNGGTVTAGLNPLTSAGTNGTFHHTLAEGAVTVDTGNNAVYGQRVGITSTGSALVTALISQMDQTKGPRLVEGNGDGVFRIDRGAAERFVSQPVAIFTPTPNPAGVGETITLNAGNSTHTLVPGDSKIVAYEWDFNYDGTTFDVDQTGVTTTSSYDAIGDVTIALRVRDDGGFEDIHTEIVSVSAPLVPVITAPTTSGTSDLTPTIQWTAGSGNFTLEVTNVNTGEVVINRVGFASPPAPAQPDQPDPNAELRCADEENRNPREHCFTPSTAMSPGTYEAVVTATNSSGVVSSAPYRFDVIKIALTDPLNFDIEFDTTPELRFTAIPNAARYQVWISQLSDDVNANGSRTTIGIRVNDSFVDAVQAQISGTNLAGYEPASSLGEGYFRVWVRAIEANGNTGHWSAGSQFRITKPQITGPVLASRATLDSTPTITWTDVGANQYEIWLTQRDGSLNGTALTGPVVVFNGIVQGTSYTPPTALGDGNFRVWVRAVDDDGEAGLWSTGYDFTKDLTTGPTLISPIQKVTVTDRTPVFEWQALDGADHYEIWVNNINTGAPRVIHDTMVPHVDGATTITFTADPAVVLRNASYRWWVRAFNADGQAAAWTAPEIFFVPSPSINAPVGAVAGTNSPVFSWRGVPEYVRYELWVNNDTTGISRVIYEPNLTTTTFTPTLPLQNGNFRVWVRGFDVEGNASQWSNPAAFSVNATVANAPTPLEPDAQGTVFVSTPRFLWTPLSNIAQYEILVKRLLGNSQPEVIREFTQGAADPAGTGALFYDTTTNLVPGTYRWWIRGLNQDGTPGPWSQPLDFRVADNDPQPMTLENETLVASFQQSETWADDLHSITIHPAAVVAAHLPAETEPVIVDGTPEAAPEVMKAVDSVMQELTVTDWLIDSEIQRSGDDGANVSTPDVDRQTATTAVPKESEDKQTTATALGMMLAAFGGKRHRNRRRDNEM